jgi:hypothetical protein
MTDIKTIQNGILARYQAITLPNSLGLPTVERHEKAEIGETDLPYIVVERSIMTNRSQLATKRWQVIREYIVDLYCYEVTENKEPFTTERDNAIDCVDTIQKAFDQYGGDLAGTKNVLLHAITADTGDTELYTRGNNRNFIGVRIRHQITYIQKET